MQGAKFSPWGDGPTSLPWVAFAYANGHLFIVPNNVWCYSDEKGEHAYVGPDEVLLPLYRFVRRNERLLDGYDPMEQIGVVYGTGGAAKAADGDATRRGRANPGDDTEAHPVGNLES